MRGMTDFGVFFCSAMRLRKLESGIGPSQNRDGGEIKKGEFGEFASRFRTRDKGKVTLASEKDMQIRVRMS